VVALWHLFFATKEAVVGPGDVKPMLTKLELFEGYGNLIEVRVC